MGTEGALAAPTCPGSWTLPQMPDDDVAAIRALADTYQQLASELSGALQMAQLAMSALPGAWTGAGADAAVHPTAVLTADTDAVNRGLVEAATALRACAAELEEAQEKHRWTWGKVLKLGAVVVVSGAAIYVTAGLAAPGLAATNSALIGGEVAVAQLAVTSALAARTGVTVALQSSTRLFGALRGLAAVVRPQLPYAVAFTGAEAGGQVAATGSLDPERLAISFGLGLAVPAGVLATRTAVRTLPSFAERPAAGVVASHLAAGGVVAGVDATRQQLATGRVDTSRVVHAGVTGSVFSAAGEVGARIASRGGGPGVVPGGFPGDALPARQSLDAAMRHGVDLSAHEGPKLGHTLSRHVGKPWSYLQQRLDTEKGNMKSTFTDEATANRAVTETLRAHRDKVLAFERGEVGSVLPLVSTFEHRLGDVLLRSGERLSGTTCKVVLNRDSSGAFVLTAYVTP